MKFELVAIAPADLSRKWPEIREEVASVESPENTIPEDVFMMCKTNAATLFYMMADDFRIGYVILRVIYPDLHIWQVKTVKGYSKNDINALVDFRPQLMDICRRANCVGLTFGTGRPGWNKVAPVHGFKKRLTVYECPLDPISDAIDLSPKNSQKSNN